MEPQPHIAAEGPLALVQDGGAAFRAFSTAHVVTLLICAAVAVGLCWLVRGGAARLRRPVLLLVGITLLAAELWARGEPLSSGTWSARSSLPLHLCDLAAFVASLALLREAVAGEAARRASTPQFLAELTYYWGLGGGTQALLTPELDAPLGSPRFFVFFVSHGLTLAAALLLTVGLRRPPRPGSALRVWLLTSCFVPPMLVVNALTGGNYMYVRGKPAKPSLYDYFGPWPWSILSLEAAALLIMHVCYLPYFLTRPRRNTTADLRSPIGSAGRPN
ncbi:MAG: hypothetical protein CHACPFDD_00292 [Phycisphaerae bacterium]|nr:hypothetical protein [Phycisphaerae bacterium]